MKKLIILILLTVSSIISVGQVDALVGESGDALESLSIYIDKEQDLNNPYWIDRPAPGFMISHFYDPHRDLIVSCVAKPLGDEYVTLQIRYLNANYTEVTRNKTWLYYRFGLLIYVTYIDGHFVWLINEPYY